ncbi:MAG: insulinase family protein [Variovorax sp.]|nr:MAG: insulinase family protein [Variovorax sp.]
MKHPSPRRAASGAVLASVLLASWAWPVLAQTPPASAASPSPAIRSAPVLSNSAATRAQQFTLANGMALIVQPDRRSPTAVHMLWLRVGAIDEVDGTTGVAHVLEHMLFKGTKDLKAGEFSRRVAALGGRENAFTSRDFTGYYQQIPNGKLEDVMKLEADRFANNQWPDDEFKRELEVVKEERRMRTDDQPRALLGEQHNAAIFTASPYRRPVVGWMSDLDAMTPDDARDFYRRWYVPANAAVVVTGDVDVAEVRAWAEKHYGRIPARAVPERKPRTEPPQRGIKRIEFKAPAEQAYVSLAFRAPQFQSFEADGADSDVWPLLVLSAVLDGYAGARLDRALTQGPDRIADSAGAYAGFVGRGPQLFVLDGVPAAGKTAEQVEAALRAQVARVAKEGVGEAELARVKTQWVASETYKLDSVMAQARELGSNWVQGLPLDASDRIIARLSAVTAAQVQAVAAKYFGDDQLTVATLRPLPPQAPRPRGFAAPTGELR